MILVDERHTGGRWKRFLIPGPVRFPLRHVAEEPQLHEALRGGIRTAVRQRRIEVGSAATEAFALESTSTSD